MEDFSGTKQAQIFEKNGEKNKLFFPQIVKKVMASTWKLIILNDKENYKIYYVLDLRRWYYIYIKIPNV